MSDLLALLQTDIVDSTELTESLGDEKAARLWAAHDRIARTLIHRWRGREIERSDGFILVFDRAADAVAFAMDYHRELAALEVPMRARAGLHVAPVALIENSPADVAIGTRPVEVRGLAVAIAARLMNLAQGGQTLLTAEANAAVGSTSWQVRGHGHWRLKGVREPLEVFEVGQPDAVLSPPPDAPKAFRVVREGNVWLPVARLRHSLPAERDGFIGRVDALDQLVRRFEDGARLVSVLGIGGMGKTRLVQRFGWTFLGEYAGGVWFCDLSQARSLDGLIHAVAQGLDVPLGRGDPITQLGAAIAGRGTCLIILDNFEQVGSLAESTVGRWLDGAREAHFIVTTREVLGIVGEQDLALAPMPPADGAELFIQRAAAVRSDFGSSKDDTAAIETLVRLLDGLPLAIELAAARVRVMPPRMLLARMSERFKLLASPSGRIDRQATLKAAFDWSWELLAPPEKAALAQLSVFEGGFTLAAAEVVLDLTMTNADTSAIDLMQSLVQKSLVRQVDDHRFGLLMSVQEYVALHLRTEGRFPGSGPAAFVSACTRHWHYYSGLKEREAVADRCVEIDNLVEACRRAAKGGDTQMASNALAGAWAALKLRGPFRSAVELAALVRAAPNLADGEQAIVEWVAGSALNLLGESKKARGHLESALHFARVGANRLAEARSLYAIGDQLAGSGELTTALPMLENASSIARELGDRGLQCAALNGLGALHGDAGDLEEAELRYGSALAIARELGDAHWEGGLLGNLAGLAFAQGKLDSAQRDYEAALALAEASGDRRWEGNTRSNLGLVYHESGQSARARPQLESALALARSLGHMRLQSTVLCNLGIVADALEERINALRHYQDAVAVAHELDDRRLEGQFRGYLGRALAQASLHDQAHDCLSHGAKLLEEIADRPSLCQLLCMWTEAASLAGDRQQATATFRHAEQLGATLGASESSELGQALERARTSIT